MSTMVCRSPTDRESGGAERLRRSSGSWIQDNGQLLTDLRPPLGRLLVRRPLPIGAPQSPRLRRRARDRPWSGSRRSSRVCAPHPRGPSDSRCNYTLNLIQLAGLTSMSTSSIPGTGIGNSLISSPGTGCIFRKARTASDYRYPGSRAHIERITLGPPGFLLHGHPVTHSFQKPQRRDLCQAQFTARPEGASGLHGAVVLRAEPVARLSPLDSPDGKNSRCRTDFRRRSAGPREGRSRAIRR